MRARIPFLFAWAVWGFMAVLVCVGSPAVAQDTADDEPEAASAAADDEKKKMPFALYVEASLGQSQTNKDLNASIQNTSGVFGKTFIDLKEVDFARAAVGWRFPEGRGDARLVFRGYEEKDYSLISTGFNRQVKPPPPATSTTLVGFDVPWWRVTINDGVLTAARYPVTWVSSGPGDPTPDPGEVKCGIPGLACDTNGALPPDRMVTRQVADSLQNRIQTIDLVYGREFGTRRFSSHWWTGLRLFEYTGQIVGGAWLVDSSATVGEGFSDGELFPMVRMIQESTGVGPTGAWEVDFNFFDKGVVLYFKGEAAFLAATVETDSGNFYTAATGNFAVPARVQDSRDKSQWQTGFEIGGRVILKNGLHVEVAFSRVGFLDAILFPFFNFGVSESGTQQFAGAGLGTQDIILDTTHFAVGYQF